MLYIEVIRIQIKVRKCLQAEQLHIVCTKKNDEYIFFEMLYSQSLTVNSNIVQ